MATSSSNDRLSYGLTLLIFGLLFLLDKVGVLTQIPYGDKFITVGAFFLIGGVVFIATQPKKALGWIFLAIGVFLNADLFFGWISSYSKFIIPIALIVAGLVMVFTGKKSK